MQLVGATASWIYLPFILQGIAFGVAGAVIAWALIASIQEFLANLLATGPDFIQFIVGGAQPNPLQLLLLPLLLLSLGTSIGLIGSLFAVRRFASR